MSRLSKRMNAGVGSSRAMNANFAGSDFFQGAFQLVLDSVALLLTLPARERRAVVRDCELKPRRHFVRDPERPAKSFGPLLDRPSSRVSRLFRGLTQRPLRCDGALSR